MRQNAQGQEAVMRLLGEQFQRIRPLEEAWGIRFREADMRPRIEHFHDAVRALSAGDARAFERGGRLSVEYLAYDLAQLRIIQDKPAGTIHRGTHAPDAGALVVAGATGARRSPDAKTRSELSALYKFYTLLYAALFAEQAEDDFKLRSEQAESQLDDLAQIEQVLNALVKGQMNAKQAHAALDHVERDDLREAMQAMAAKGKFSPADMMKAKGMVGTIKQGLQGEKKTVADAHLSYATGQLAVYEAGKDTVKKMASQGLNVAGKFLEQATHQAGHGRGR